jgi:hypothetical protein
MIGLGHAIRSTLRERFVRPKVAVCTAVTRNYDIVVAPAMRVRGWRYVCFTDDPAVPRPGWEIRALPRSDLDPIRRSRLPKLLPHAFLPEYDQSIWIDANIGIVGDLAALLRMALADADIAFFRHGERRPSVAAEIEACVRYGKAPYEVMAPQYEHYRSKGFPDDAGVIPEASVIFRRHHHPNIRVAMEAWWAEYIAHCARDQISLPYVIWLNSLKVNLLDWDFRKSPWFYYGAHEL